MPPPPGFGPQPGQQYPAGYQQPYNPYQPSQFGQAPQGSGFGNFAAQVGKGLAIRMAIRIGAMIVVFVIAGIVALVTALSH